MMMMMIIVMMMMMMMMMNHTLYIPLHTPYIHTLDDETYPYIPPTDIP